MYYYTIPRATLLPPGQQVSHSLVSHYSLLLVVIGSQILIELSANLHWCYSSESALHWSDVFEKLILSLRHFQQLWACDIKLSSVDVAIAKLTVVLHILNWNFPHWRIDFKINECWIILVITGMTPLKERTFVFTTHVHCALHATFPIDMLIQCCLTFQPSTRATSGNPSCLEGPSA